MFAARNLMAEKAAPSIMLAPSTPVTEPPLRVLLEAADGTFKDDGHLDCLVITVDDDFADDNGDADAEADADADADADDDDDDGDDE